MALKLGEKGIPCVTLHDGRTIRYPDPLIKVNDTVLLDIATNKIKDFMKVRSPASLRLCASSRAPPQLSTD